MHYETIMKNVVDVSRAFLIRDIAAIEEILSNAHPEFLKCNGMTRKMGSKCLYKCIVANDLSMAELFVNHGVDLELLSPLYEAMARGNMRFIELLLRHGAKLQVPYEQASEVFREIFRKKLIRKDVIALFHKYDPANIAVPFNQYGERLLHQFVKFVDKGDRDAIEVAQILIDVGLPVDEPNEDGWTPLMSAIMLQNTPLVAFFIQNGADVNKMSKFEVNFPLLLAVAGENEDLVKLLISKGADVNAKTQNENRTALHEACTYHLDKIIDVLIANGADISVYDSRVRTPFSLLKSRHVNYDTCARVIVKRLSMMCFEDPVVFQDYENFLKAKATTEKLANNCLDELYKMAATKVYGDYSFYDVLKMSNDALKIARLSSYEEFVSNFENGLKTEFNIYGKDLRGVFDLGMKVKNDFAFVFSKLSRSALGTIYPGAVLRKVSENLTLEDVEGL